MQPDHLHEALVRGIVEVGVAELDRAGVEPVDVHILDGVQQRLVNARAHGASRLSPAVHPCVGRLWKAHIAGRPSVPLCGGVRLLRKPMPPWRCLPKRVLKPPAGQFHMLSAASGYVCALSTAGFMTCWGARGAEAALPGKLTSIAAGMFGTCAIDESGNVRCLGIEPGSAPDGSFTQISMSDYSACGLRDGLAVCWGVNTGGPIARSRQAPSGRFTSLSVDRFTTCGVRPDGRVVCWGALEWPDEPRPNR
jgi:hypothetical protein